MNAQHITKLLLMALFVSVLCAVSMSPITGPANDSQGTAVFNNNLQGTIAGIEITETQQSVVPAAGTHSFNYNDPYYEKQWAFHKIPYITTEQNNNRTTIAILDTGIDQKHEDLQGKVVNSINFSDSTTSADINGHGTHIAGIIAAIPNNHIGIAGVAPNTQLLNVKVADDKGNVWTSDVAEGITWAVDNGANVINLSLVLPTPSPSLEQAIEYAWSNGVIIVAGAGNNIKSATVYPAFYPHVIAVAASDQDGNLWSKSNNADFVDAYAPGVEIYSTLCGNKYGYHSGTSMATAYVSAVTATVLATATDLNGNGRINDEVVSTIETLFGSTGQ